MPITENLAAVRERIARAVKRAGGRTEDISLMAVSKTNPPENIRAAYDAGLRLFGENRVQEFAGKAEALRDLHDAEWHMIGHLQTNKAARTAELFHAVDSVDSLKLAEKLDAAARNLGRKLNVLVEINVGGETAKSGVAPDSQDLEELLSAAPRLEALRSIYLFPQIQIGNSLTKVQPHFREQLTSPSWRVFRHVPNKCPPGTPFKEIARNFCSPFPFSTAYAVDIRVLGERIEN